MLFQQLFKPSRFSLNVVLLLTLALSGCSSLSQTTQNQQAYLNSILPELISKQVVLVGESHTSYADHQTQLAVIKALHPHWPKMGVGIEFVQSPYQSVLDHYVAGKLTDKQMLKQTQWYKRWRYDFRLYRDIFHYAKKHQLPLIALNAPTELTKKISEQGIAGLSVQDRKKLPKKISTSKAYWQRLNKVYQQHAHGKSKGINNFVDVQLAWDESMAFNATKAINSGKVSHIVLLAGSGHVLRQAIPERLQHTSTIIVTNSGTYADDKEQVDFVLLSNDKAKLPSSGKIGILMSFVNHEVVVSKVLESHSAGLKKNDHIITIDSINMKSLEDIKIALFDKKVGEVIDVVIKRDGRSIHKNIKLY